MNCNLGKLFCELIGKNQLRKKFSEQKKLNLPEYELRKISKGINSPKSKVAFALIVSMLQITGATSCFANGG